MALRDRKMMVQTTKLPAMQTPFALEHQHHWEGEGQHNSNANH
ncbi:MAG: hypothetical protein ACLRXB_04655 [Escherichia coli]